MEPAWSKSRAEGRVATTAVAASEAIHAILMGACFVGVPPLGLCSHADSHSSIQSDAKGVACAMMRLTNGVHLDGAAWRES